jgi:hypothetical protein
VSCGAEQAARTKLNPACGPPVRSRKASLGPPTGVVPSSIRHSREGHPTTFPLRNRVSKFIRYRGHFVLSRVGRAHNISKRSGQTPRVHHTAGRRGRFRRAGSRRRSWASPESYSRCLRRRFCSALSKTPCATDVRALAQEVYYGVGMSRSPAAMARRVSLSHSTRWRRDDESPLGRAIQRSGVIVAIPILSGLHHQYVRI